MLWQTLVVNREGIVISHTGEMLQHVMLWNATAHNVRLGKLRIVSGSTVGMQSGVIIHHFTGVQHITSGVCNILIGSVESWFGSRWSSDLQN